MLLRTPKALSCLGKVSSTIICNGTPHPDGQIAAKQATAMLVKPLAGRSGHTGKEWLCKTIRASHKGWSVGGSHQEDMTTS